jgi:hypothetical protein
VRPATPARPVKPSAQPTMVRIHHPPPAKIRPDLRIRRFVRRGRGDVCGLTGSGVVPVCRGGHGHLADTGWGCGGGRSGGLRWLVRRSAAGAWSGWAGGRRDMACPALAALVGRWSVRRVSWRAPGVVRGRGTGGSRVVVLSEWLWRGVPGLAGDRGPAPRAGPPTG